MKRLLTPRSENVQHWDLPSSPFSQPLIRDKLAGDREGDPNVLIHDVLWQRYNLKPSRNPGIAIL